MPMGKKISWLGCTFKASLNSGTVTWNGSQVMQVHCYCAWSYISKFNTL